jgi:hypothetical protein
MFISLLAQRNSLSRVKPRETKEKAYFITMTTDEPESRREWLLPLLKKYCAHLKREQEYKLWQDGNHAKVIYSAKFFYEKLNYIHQNPVQDMLVEKPEEYLLSSARNYADQPGLLEIILETPQLKTYVNNFIK